MDTRDFARDDGNVPNVSNTRHAVAKRHPERYRLGPDFRRDDGRIGFELSTNGNKGLKSLVAFGMLVQGKRIEVARESNKLVYILS